MPSNYYTHQNLILQKGPKVGLPRVRLKLLLGGHPDWPPDYDLKFKVELRPTAFLLGVCKNLFIIFIFTCIIIFDLIFESCLGFTICSKAYSTFIVNCETFTFELVKFKLPDVREISTLQVANRPSIAKNFSFKPLKILNYSLTA